VVGLFCVLKSIATRKEQAMMKINSIGDYEGEYRISVIEGVLVVVNAVLLVVLMLYRKL
jgi:hypothetical protein